MDIKLFLSFTVTYWKNLPINRKMLNIKKKKRRSKKKHVLTKKKKGKGNGRNYNVNIVTSAIR